MSENIKLGDEPKRLAKVIRRDISWEKDLVSLPDESWPDEKKTFVKTLTSMILMPAGIYVMVVWDYCNDRPGIMIVNHSLFHQLRDWHRDFMRPVINTIFQIEYYPQNNMAYHRMTPMGEFPVLDEPRKEKAEEYISDLFTEAWVPDIGAKAAVKTGGED